MKKRSYLSDLKKLRGRVFLAFAATLSILLLCQSCSVDAESIAEKAIKQAETEAMKVFASTAASDEGIPAGDLPRLNYVRDIAGLKATKKLRESLNMDDDSESYSNEQHAHLHELMDSAHATINRHYDPLIIEELKRIEGDLMLCFDTDGITNVEAKIEHVKGTRNIRVRLEGTMTRKGRYLHYKLHSPLLSNDRSIGATKLFNMDKSIKRYLNMPGERVYGYIILDEPFEQATTAIEIRRINY